MLASRWRARRWVLAVFSAVLALGASTSAAGGSVAAPSVSSDVVAPVLAAGTSLPAAIRFLERALTLRANEIATLSAKVAGAKSLTASDKSALDAALLSASAGIASLEARAAGEPNFAAVRSDLSAMVLDYHVLAFLEPQVHAVIAVDADLALGSQLLGQQTAIAAAIAAASQAHKNVAREQSLMATFRARVAAVSSTVAGLSAMLLSLGPSSVPGSLATLAAASVATSRASLEASEASAAEQRIVTLLARPGAGLAAVLGRS